MKKRFCIKLILTGLLVVLGILELSAQQRPDGTSPQFLFPEFKDGKAIMKKGKPRIASMNYNTVSEKMVFYQGEKILEMTETDRIDTVLIQGRKFIPMGKVFYEVIHMDRISLFVEHKGDLMLPGKPAAYGGTSQTSAISTVSSMEFDNRYVNMELPSDYTVRINNIYWIKKDGAMSDFISEKQFMKIFPDKNTELKKYIKQAKVKFDRIPDVQKLIIFCNEIN
jgi:hypothetical protein